MFTDIIWRFLILETFVMGALCILCSYEHPQKYFCKSEFVLKMKFRKETKLSVGHGFRMEIITIYKGNIKKLNIMNHRYVNMVLPRKVFLSAGKKYFVFGRNNNGNILSNLCYGIKSAKDIYRRGLATFYKSGCNCVHKKPRYTVDRDCHWKYSYMVKRGKRCSWAKTRNLQICQALLEEVGKNPLFNHQHAQRKY